VAQSDFQRGVHIHVGPSFNRFDLYWPRFAELNVTSYRAEVVWSAIEQQKGQYTFITDPYPAPDTFKYVDEMIRNAHFHGISPLVILGYANPLYDGGGLPISDEAQAAFVKYAVFIAQRYKGVVHQYELWNEWNIGLGVSVSPRVLGTAEDYVRLLKKVYVALKAVDPDIVLIAGAVAQQDIGWTQKALAAGAGTAMDAYSIHPYNFPNVPEQVFDYLGKLEQTLKSATGRDVPIYVTELGWHTAVNPSAVTRSTQADYLARLYLAAPMYSFLKGIWWYDFRDDNPNPANVHDNFGLYDNDYVQKPAACAMADVGRLLGAYTPVSLSMNSRGIWVAKYSDGATQLFAIWTQAPSATVSAAISTTGPSGAKINARGICRTIAVQGNGSTRVSTVISNSPTILTTPADGISVE
jgi:hypothetical protein